MVEERHQVTAYATGLAGLVAMSLASCRAFPRHSHDQYGIGLVVSGGQRSWSGIGRVEALAGDVITVNPGEMHDGAPIDGACRGWHMLYFDPALVHQAVSDAAAGTELTQPALNDPLLQRLLRQLFHQLTAAPADTLGVEERCCQLLGAAFSRHGSYAFSAVHDIPGTIAKVRQRLDDAPQQQVSLIELADMAGMSRYQLLRSFSRALGITPHAYLVQRRVQIARRLIDGGHTLSQAALAAGFSDQSHMSRAFHRQLGITPGRYRHTIQQS